MRYKPQFSVFRHCESIFFQKTLIIKDIVYNFAAVLTRITVKKLTELMLPLKGLPFGNQVINVHLDGSFFDETEPCEVRSASINVSITVNHRMDEIITLDMAIKGELTIPCDRCLDDMTHPVDTTYHLTVKAGETLDDCRDNVLQVPSNWKELDLTPIVRDTVMLTIPIMHVHDSTDDCNQNMTAWLKEYSASDDDCQVEPATGHDPRWDALKQLIENNK